MYIGTESMGIYLKQDHLNLGQRHFDAAAATNLGEKYKFVGFKNKKDDDKSSRKNKKEVFV